MKLAEQSWMTVRDILVGAHTVAILPCGATEAHGPHLPLNTDVIISEGMARRAAEKLRRSGIGVLILPSLAYTPAEYAAAFAGTVTISPRTLKLLLIDIARNLQSQGFVCLALANSHFDPANVAVLRETSEAIRSMGLPVAYPDFTRRALAQTLTEEFVSGACHAGQFETSLIMAERPDLVNDPARRALTPNPSSLLAAFTKGAKNFADAGGPDAYFGDPGAATADEGERSLNIMADALVSAVHRELEIRGNRI